MNVEWTVVLEDEVPYAEVDVRVSLFKSHDLGELEIYTIEVWDITNDTWHVLKNQYSPVSIAVWRQFNKRYDELMEMYDAQ